MSDKSKRIIDNCLQACANWGLIPTAFRQCMTWEEQVLWLARFLQTEVIPKMNATITEVEELEHWFENLDVQEEINNKLDEMAESGQLADIIAEYLETRAILAYDTVAAMKASDTLSDGSFAQTYGFYTKGDMGGAKYKIREVTNEDTVDEMTLIALDDVSLVAELIKEPVMNVKQFGAKGDGETDDTAKIQGCLDNISDVIIPNGTYMVNAVTSIKPNTNNSITLCEDATIKAIANDQTHYAVVKIDNVDNVRIKGGTIQGERDTHEGEEGEWGFGISVINGSSNIIISNVIIKDTWGDGLYLNDCENVRSENVTIDNVRRNGISVVSAENYKSLNDVVYNTNGTNPQFGVDVEPNYNTEKIKGVVFDNIHFVNNTNGGFKIDLKKLDNTSEPVDITVNDMFCENSTGIKIAKSETVDGVIVFNAPKMVKSPRAAIDLTGCKYKATFPVFINKPFIYQCGTAGYTTVGYDSAIVTSGDAANGEGGFVFTESFIDNIADSASVKDFYLNGATHVEIINPVKNSTTNNKSISIAYGDDFTLIDPRRVYQDATDYNSNLGGSNAPSYITNTAASSANRTKTISQYAPVGYEFTVSNLSSNRNLGITLTECYCKALSSTQGVTITLAPHALMKLRKITATEFELIDQVGTLTVA